MRGDRWIRGLIGAALLTLFCVSISAWLIELHEGPFVARRRWPHIETRFLALVCVPAAALWFWYFAFAWRGRALLKECWDLARPIVTSPRAIIWLAVFGVAGLLVLDSLLNRVH